MKCERAGLYSLPNHWNIEIKAFDNMMKFVLSIEYTTVCQDVINQSKSCASISLHTEPTKL